ncbi:MAG: hypothetical protein KF817_13050 [Phycisphaeraceae bacterium]|nr:hypothetical protein [Phycisphaeraceae bacterium]
MLKIGLILGPLAMLLGLLRDRGPAGRFVDAGAISPDTARRPSALGIERPGSLAGLLRAGVLTALPDGRVFVDPGRFRRRRRRTIAAAIGLYVVAAAVVVVTVMVVRSDR